MLLPQRRERAASPPIHACRARSATAAACCCAAVPAVSPAPATAGGQAVSPATSMATQVLCPCRRQPHCTMGIPAPAGSRLLLRGQLGRRLCPGGLSAGLGLMTQPPWSAVGRNSGLLRGAGGHTPALGSERVAHAPHRGTCCTESSAPGAGADASILVPAPSAASPAACSGCVLQAAATALQSTAECGELPLPAWGSGAATCDPAVGGSGGRQATRAAGRHGQQEPACRPAWLSRTLPVGTARRRQLAAPMASRPQVPQAGPAGSCRC